MDQIAAKNFIDMLTRILKEFKDVDMATKIQTLEDIFGQFTKEEIDKLQAVTTSMLVKK